MLLYEVEGVEGLVGKSCCSGSDICPHTGDNGNRGDITVTIARRKYAYDQSNVATMDFVWGLLDGCVMDSFNVIFYLFRWQFPLFTQGGEMELSDEAMDVSCGDILSQSGDAVNHFRQSYPTVTTDRVFPMSYFTGLSFYCGRRSCPVRYLDDCSHPFAQSLCGYASPAQG